MTRDLKLLLFLLLLPLPVLTSQYAYAAVTTSTYQVTVRTFVSPGSSGGGTAECNPGDFATGGGFEASEWVSSVSFPYPSENGTEPTGWQVYVNNPTQVTVQVVIHAVCMTPVAARVVSASTFEYFYSALIIVSLVYFAMSRRFTEKRIAPSISSSPSYPSSSHPLSNLLHEPK